jgi:phosphate butyryltransferase
MVRTFEDLEKVALGRARKSRVLAAAAHDPHTLEGINAAARKGMIEPILIGNAPEIREIISLKKLALAGTTIIDAQDDKSCARIAARMAANGEGDAIMKGKLQTSDLLREIVNKENGLLRGELMSHVGLFSAPAYHKLFVLTDGGMVIAPDADGKRKILENAVRTLAAIGAENPKVAVLCATETPNPGMPASVDAALLKRQSGEGVIKGCVVEGPISLDLALDAESARIKGYESPVAGDADILLAPDMTAGNLMAKTFMFAGKSMMAGLIAGAKIPIILVSRGATAEEKFWSIVFAAAVS